jgi:hypothetical protein
MWAQARGHIGDIYPPYLSLRERRPNLDGAFALAWTVTG